MKKNDKDKMNKAYKIVKAMNKSYITAHTAILILKQLNKDYEKVNKKTKS